MRAARQWALPDIRPDITPLIGVLFVLMAVFMASTPPGTNSLSFNTPPEGCNSYGCPRNILFVSIMSGNDIYINGKRILVPELDSRIDTTAAHLNSHYVMVRGDAKLPYNTFFQIVAHLQNRGYHVALINEDME